MLVFEKAGCAGKGEVLQGFDGAFFHFPSLHMESGKEGEPLPFRNQVPPRSHMLYHSVFGKPDGLCQ